MSEQSNQSAGLLVAATADVDERAVLGPGTAVWHLAQIREHARLGRDCIVGRGAYVGPGVVIGNNVKLQNYALVYEPAQLEDGVFIGPAVVLTNDMYPRSVDVSGKLKRPSDWTPEGVIVREGASLGARAVVVAGRVIGRWALVAAGAVVTRDVPDFALCRRSSCQADRVGRQSRGTAGGDLCRQVAVPAYGRILRGAGRCAGSGGQLTGAAVMGGCTPDCTVKRPMRRTGEDSDND